MYTDNKHKLVKIILRIIGFSLIGLSIIGAILLIIFFSQIDFMLQPVFIFLTILPTVIAIPLIFLSFASNIGKYGAKESVEIQKQVMKDIIDDSKQFSKEIASSVKETVDQNNIICSYCHHKNSIDAKYCDECGKLLEKTCPICNTKNDNDAKYCKKCGNKLY